MGGASHLLEPLVEALWRNVFDCGKLHADDTPVPVLALGTGKTGRLWTYVRDDRPAGDKTGSRWCGLPTRPTERESIRSSTCATSAARCRLTPSIHVTVSWTLKLLPKALSTRPGPDAYANSCQKGRIWAAALG